MPPWIRGLGWLVALLWAGTAVWLGIYFEPVYLAWLGSSAEGDPDHITRMFAIGLMCWPAIALVNGLLDAGDVTDQA